MAALAQFVIDPSAVAGSFLSHVFALCNGEFDTIMHCAGGEFERERINTPAPQSELVDSISSLLAVSPCQATRCLLRLLTSM